ncbi:heavy metal translocating P-type ATPase [Agrilactobacillus yilanensis]|uniref:P-type Cu(+) transporter n=1 Tax=Agrilactobacillus yilanensis TaxID=2485997 RepID=A0ABW4JAB2_9LACO|nr:heavy metal translocating P-type ATPase [Agrilactobacillus yilanensis]
MTDHDQMAHETMTHDMSNMDHDMSEMDHGDMMNHGGHMMHMGNLKQKFWVSLVLTLPILLMTSFMGMTQPLISFPYSEWVVAVIGTILFFYGGKPFFSGAKGEIQARQPAMMLLIAMGITVAYIYSIYAVIANNVFHVDPMIMDFFWELATLIDIMLLGHWVEMNAVMGASSALDDLAKLLPSAAHKVSATGEITEVAIKDLQEGDLVLVKAGEKIPADGILTSGTSMVNEAMVTGESRLVAKAVDDSVFGGAVNSEGTFQMTVTGTGETGFLAQVTKLVQSAQQDKSAQENLADKVSGWLFYAALTVGILAFIIWFINSGLTTALPITVTVLVIACPHALGLAVPLVVARSTSIAAKNGLLIRNRNALEQVKDLKYALMDKTGTLTMGNFKVNAYDSLTDDVSKEEVLTLLASLEAGSSHPLAVGIMDAAKDKALTYDQAQDVKQITGVGLEGQVAQKTYQVVSMSYLLKLGLTFDQKKFEALAANGNSISFLLTEDQVIGYVAQGDEIKPEAKNLIDALLAQGITPVMLTGDNRQTAEKVAKTLGITEVQAQLLPEDKEKLVRQYQTKGKVLMIGDGVNDAPSLARADIGIAIGSGTDVAIESADVVLVKSNPNDVVEFLELARKTTRKMTENLWWGAGYNILALPLAAGVLAPIGFLLSPMLGAVLMSLSTIIVAINAMTLRLKNNA